MKTFTSFLMESADLQTHKKFVENIPHGEGIVHEKSKNAFSSAVYIPNKHVKTAVDHYKKNGFEHSIENHSNYGKTHVLTKGKEKARMFDNGDGSHELTHTSPREKSEPTDKSKAIAKKAKITKLLKPKALRIWD
jgi:hypothetical protein